MNDPLGHVEITTNGSHKVTDHEPPELLPRGATIPQCTVCGRALGSAHGDYSDVGLAGSFRRGGSTPHGRSGIAGANWPDNRNRRGP